jgi:hypothetical protein
VRCRVIAYDTNFLKRNHMFNRPFLSLVLPLAMLAPVSSNAALIQSSISSLNYAIDRTVVLGFLHADTSPGSAPTGNAIKSISIKNMSFLIDHANKLYEFV